MAEFKVGFRVEVLTRFEGEAFSIGTITGKDAEDLAQGFEAIADKIRELNGIELSLFEKARRAASKYLISLEERTRPRFVTDSDGTVTDTFADESDG